MPSKPSHLRTSGRRRARDDRPRPVRLKRRRAILENQVYRVYTDHVIDRQNGSEVEDFLVVQPRRSRGDMVTGVSVLPIFEGAVMLLRSYRHAMSRWIVEIPTGFIDADETPAKAAIRELEEEIGLTCPRRSLVALGYYAPEPGLIAARVALFAALECRATKRQRDHSEIGLGAAQKLSLEKARMLLETMRIEDAATAIALHRYFLLQRP